MAKFPAAESRLFKGKFVCRRCKSVIRSTNMKIISEEVTCRRCGSHAFKGKRKK
ncbi:50S ribosomal protein L40e [Candidatus Woesearchaeota archaeon]|nr:50S ribosomal protein L40e [Candidatus Woesearchaeota archaeon]